jgi:DsbC/DsbD-like thiol-disulfide interchange protein
MRFSTWGFILIGLWAATASAAIDDLVPGAPAAGPGTDAVQAKLLADVSTFQVGQPFTVGVRLDLKSGWHVYWQDSGQSGLPTKVVFKVPEGYTVSAPSFPAPRTFQLPGNVVVWGYERTVLITAVVTPPPILSASKAVPISATVNWLCCNAETCVPGKADVQMTINPGLVPVADNATLFADWAKRMPADAELSALVRSITWESRLPAGVVPWSGACSVRIDWKKAPPQIDWYPMESENVLVKDIAVQTSGSITTIRFTVSANVHSQASELTFSSVIAFNDDKGDRHGLTLRVSPAAAR